MTVASVDPKQAAVECWTADPCGAAIAGEPGSADYARELVDSRSAFAPWVAEVLDYAGTSGMAVLDVGCGQGMDLIGYARAGAHVTGIDLTPRHAELARSHLDALGLHGEVVVGDAESMPFADASFDRVSSNGVLHHTPDMGAALREIQRVLRPGGEARIILYNRHSLHFVVSQVAWRGILKGQLRREGSIANLLSAGVETSSIGARPLVRVYSARDVREALTGAGFTRVHTVVRHFHWNDLPGGRLLGTRAPGMTSRIGRLAGWYVVGCGSKP